MARLRIKTKYPLLRAARWEFGRAFAGSSSGALLLTCLAGACVTLVGFWSVIRPVLVSHLLTVSVLLALQASLLARAGHRKWTDHYTTGWLCAIPAA
jgi:CBS-domain-containing membrane protein